jgi:polar amino acid transport system substrate-binding protein
MNRSNKIIFINKKKLEKLAVTDELTGLFTRKKLDEVLKNEFLRSKRYKHKFCLMILDIDYFKEVNDTFGHQVGDYVLVEIVNLINLNKRATDVAIRWGGEEFIVLFLETDINRAIILAEKFRQIIEEHIFELIGNKTVSIGITQNIENDTSSTLIKRADDALFNAKNSGRNRVDVI